MAKNSNGSNGSRPWASIAISAATLAAFLGPMYKTINDHGVAIEKVSVLTKELDNVSYRNEQMVKDLRVDVKKIDVSTLARESDRTATQLLELKAQVLRLEAKLSDKEP